MIPFGRKLSHQGKSGPAKASILLDFPRHSNEYSLMWKDKSAAKAFSRRLKPICEFGGSDADAQTFLNISTNNEPSMWRISHFRK